MESAGNLCWALREVVEKISVPMTAAVRIRFMLPRVKRCPLDEIRSVRVSLCNSIDSKPFTGMHLLTVLSLNGNLQPVLAMAQSDQPEGPPDAGNIPLALLGK